MGNALRDKTVLVVGRGSGIARAVALLAWSEGARVVAAGRDRAKLAAAYDGCDIGAEVVDVTDDESIAALADRVGAVDHVVSTASARARGKLSELERRNLLQSFDTKVIGPTMLAKHFAPQINPGGSVVLFSGVHAFKLNVGYLGVGITNGAVDFLTRWLAVELAASEALAETGELQAKPVVFNALTPQIVELGLRFRPRRFLALIDVAFVLGEIEILLQLLARIRGALGDALFVQVEHGEGQGEILPHDVVAEFVAVDLELVDVGLREEQTVGVKRIEVTVEHLRGHLRVEGFGLVMEMGEDVGRLDRGLRLVGGGLEQDVVLFRRRGEARSGERKEERGADRFHAARVEGEHRSSRFHGCLMPHRTRIRLRAPSDRRGTRNVPAVPMRRA